MVPTYITSDFLREYTAKDDAPLAAAVMITTKGISSFFFIRSWKKFMMTLAKARIKNPRY